MNAKIFGVIGFLIGAVAGSIATYFATQSKFDKRLEAEIAEFKAGYVSDMDIRESKASEKAENDECETENAEINDIPQSVIDSSAHMRAVIREQSDNSGVNERTQYNKQIAKEDYEVKTDDIRKPYVITADDYYNPIGKMADYERIRVYYDSENGEVYDEEGNYYEDTDASVGYFNLTGISEGNQDTVFVCNEAESRLYEVCNDDPRLG